jgi:hypothetical protein
MNIRIKLIATAATTALLASGAYAAPAKKHHRAHTAPNANAALLAEVKALRQEISDLRTKVDTQSSAQAETVSQITSTQAALQATQTQVQAVQTQVAATPSVTPDQVNTQIAGAINKEHHNDKFYFKGLTITPGGFLELAGIYRNHFQGNDISSSYAIPFPNTPASHASEGRFTARQSRLSLLVQGQVNPAVTMSMYGEFDFQGAAQTANSNESNSYNPRIRNLYGTIDWDKGDHGWHVLVGQNWSLLTLNTKGITPRNELPPPEVDGQYIPGFVWARQPQVRLTGDFLDHKLWVAVSAENPATTFGGTAPAGLTYQVLGSSGFDNLNYLSLNTVPDFVGKIAYEADIGGHSLHLEASGIYRTFEAVYSGGGNETAHGYGFGGGLVFQVVPQVLDIQASGLAGKGIGRYGSAQLPDVTFAADGTVHPIAEFMVLAGATLHATKMLDIYAYAGEEKENATILSGGTYGVGLPTANNSGCFIIGGTCAGNTQRTRQLTGGFWQKIYQGSYGRAQVGIQYSYTQRQLFEGVGGEPQVSQNMGFLSFRYYPF